MGVVYLLALSARTMTEAFMSVYNVRPTCSPKLIDSEAIPLYYVVEISFQQKLKRRLLQSSFPVEWCISVILSAAEHRQGRPSRNAMTQPSSPLFSFPYLPFPLFPFLPLPFPSLISRTPSNPVRGSQERCELPSGVCQNRIWCILA